MKKEYRYALVDRDGEIVERFMLRATAMHNLPRLSKEYFSRLKIVNIQKE